MKVIRFMLNFIWFQTFCKINHSFFWLIKLCFISKRKCVLFFGNKTIIAKGKADNPLQYFHLLSFSNKIYCILIQKEIIFIFIYPLRM
jgi:hypothetical protein